MLVSRPTIRLLQTIQGQTCHGCINHDVVEDLSSDLFMKLSYYIHRAYGKKLYSYGNQTRDFSIMSRLLNRSTKALNVLFEYNVNYYCHKTLIKILN